MPSSRAPTNASGPTQLIVALDVNDRVAAGRIIAELEGLPVLYKVGFELFLSAGPDWVRALAADGRRIFLDLKFHDIPNTVAQGVKQASCLGVEMLTVHLAGGSQMIAAVKEVLATAKKPPKILGVTVLTSFDQDHWSEVTHAVAGADSTPAQSVERFAKCAAAWGTDGIVCSPKELDIVIQHAPKLIKVIPGIRPEGAETADQSRVMTPKKAAGAGADFVVVGRPILQATDRRRAAEEILVELGQTLPPKRARA